MPRKLKILFLGEPKSPNTVSWVEGLREAGCDIEIASVRTSGKEDALAVGLWFLPPRLRVLTGTANLMEIIDRTKPDIIVAYRITSYGYLAASTEFKPLVLAAQNEQITYMPRPTFFRKALLGFFARFAIRRAQMIHAWGENIKRGLLKFGADEGKILVLHRGIDTDVFHAAHAGREYSQTQPVFISTRSLEEEYMIDRLIGAFAEFQRQVPDARLVVIGDGTKKDELVKMVQDMGLDGKIAFKGRIPAAQVADELRNADFYVSLIQTEGISSSLIEARCCGLVPIVADIPASKELVDGGKDGILLDDISTASIAMAMKSAAGDAAMRAKALERAADIRCRYDRKKNLAKFVECYRTLAGINSSDVKKTHICHITTSHGPDDIRIFQRQCRSLAAEGFKVSLVARCRNNAFPPAADGVRIYPIRNILGRPGRKFILPRMAVARALKLKADIYHFHDPELLPWMCYIAKNYGIKVVWDVHELYSATIKEFHLRSFPFLADMLAKFYNKFEKLWCSPFAGIVAVTDPLRHRYEKMGYGGNCVVVRNTIDLKRLPAPVPELRKNSSFSAVASGTTNNSRCVMELVDAFGLVVEKHKNAVLNLISVFDSGKSERRIREYIDGKGLAGSIRISGFIPWNRLVAEELPKNHVGLVLYAKTENNCAGLPNRLFEYWACRLPVIATDTPLLSELVSACGGGKIVNSENPTEIASAICHYIENPEAAIADGMKGRQAVEREYNWNNDFKVLSGLYEKILGGSIAVDKHPSEGKKIESTR